MPLDRCAYCDELLEAGAEMHKECTFRAVAGSVAHIEERCACYVPGSTETDPPGMSKREAAKAAVRAWNARLKLQRVNCNGGKH